MATLARRLQRPDPSAGDPDPRRFDNWRGGAGSDRLAPFPRPGAARP